jgi:MFS superfamily sulfate permease-like transporter
MNIIAQIALTPDSIVQWLTPILVPLILAGVKRVLPNLPSVVIPLCAPALGLVIELVNVLATKHEGNFLVAAALGLVGIGLREVKENLKPSVNGGWPTKD